MVTNMSTKNDKAQLLKIFRELDKNGDGQITREELKQGFNNSLGISDTEIAELMKMSDNDASGTIDYKGTLNYYLTLEFVIAAIDRKRILSQKRIKKCFMMFDLVFFDF